MRFTQSANITAIVIYRWSNAVDELLSDLKNRFISIDLYAFLRNFEDWWEAIIFFKEDIP